MSRPSTLSWSWTYTFETSETLNCNYTRHRKFWNGRRIEDTNKRLSHQIKGMTTFIQQIIGTSTGEQVINIICYFTILYFDT